MLGSLGHSVLAPAVTYHLSRTVPLTVVPFALGPGAETISSTPGPHCALSHPPTLLPTLLLRVRTSRPGLHPGQCPWNLSQLSTFGRGTGLGVRRWSSGTICPTYKSLTMFCSMHQMLSAHLSLTYSSELPSRHHPSCPPLSQLKDSQW